MLQLHLSDQQFHCLRCDLYDIRGLTVVINVVLQRSVDKRHKLGTWVGDYWTNFSVLLISLLCRVIKPLVTSMISCSYLTGVTAAELQRHLTNMNVIWCNYPIPLLYQHFPNGDFATPTLDFKSIVMSKCLHVNISRIVSHEDVMRKGQQSGALLFSFLLARTSC